MAKTLNILRVSTDLLDATLHKNAMSRQDRDYLIQLKVLHLQPIISGACYIEGS